jgi:hypothetical protein
MILEFRPHRGKKRIQVPGQNVHVSVKRRPDGMDDVVDDEGVEEPIPVRSDCADCDRGEKGLFIVSCHCF